MKSHLGRIVWASATRWEVPRVELDTLLSRWRTQNAKLGVTGLLLYNGESFFQVLEGFPDVLREHYATIAEDRRHHLVVKLFEDEIDNRSFGDWSMGHARVARHELATIPGLHGFNDPDTRYWHCDEAMARAIVNAFAASPWRRTIS